MDFNAIIALAAAAAAISMAAINMINTATNSKKIAELEKQIDELKRDGLG